eukprot:m.248064 g.248064  ORF g.248064 m.248064 type:complete len:67 (+) comp54480_c0_seq15:1320-1520(+)
MAKPPLLPSRVNWVFMALQSRAFVSLLIHSFSSFSPSSSECSVSAPFRVLSVDLLACLCVVLVVYL